MLAAGGLLWANFSALLERGWGRYSSGAGSWSYRYSVYGWPFRFMSEHSYLDRRPDGTIFTVQTIRDHEIEPAAIAGDALIAVAALMLVWIICENLIHRRG